VISVSEISQQIKCACFNYSPSHLLSRILRKSQLKYFILSQNQNRARLLCDIVTRMPASRWLCHIPWLNKHEQ